MRIGLSHIGVSTSWVALAVGVTRCARRAVRRVVVAELAQWRATSMRDVELAEHECAYVDTETEIRPSAARHTGRAPLARVVLLLATRALVWVPELATERHWHDLLWCLWHGRPGRVYVRRQSWRSVLRNGVDRER
jgi:hypothetical protein